MINPGWKRDVCPQCHMPGRTGERFGIGVKRDDSIDTAVLLLTYHQVRPWPKVVYASEPTDDPSVCRITLTGDGPQTIAFAPALKLKVDVCGNCGVLYAFEAEEPDDLSKKAEGK